MIYTLVTKNRFGEITKVISFSCVTDYSKSLSATVTNNPVENGRQISDGVVVDLPTFDISGTVSSYDIFDDNKELVWDGEQFSLKETPIAIEETVRIEEQIENLLLESEVFTLLVSESNDRSNDVNTKYENLSKTKYQEYNNCVLTNFKTNDQSGTKDVVFLNLTIKQLNIAFVRKDALTKDEIQPSLQKVPRKSSSSGSNISSTNTNSTDTSGLGLENSDAAQGSKIAESGSTDDSVSFKHIKSELDQKKALNDANETVNQKLFQGQNAYRVDVLGGYEVRVK